MASSTSASLLIVSNEVTITSLAVNMMRPPQ
jgi:hypothetical protein